MKHDYYYRFCMEYRIEDEPDVLSCVQCTPTCGFQQEQIAQGCGRITCWYTSVDEMRETESILGGRGLLRTYAASKVASQDWNKKWYESIEPLQLSEKIVVSPTWRPPARLEKDQHWIRIEPKMAFGTGYHQTTRLVIRAMQAYASRLEGARILDVGTGTGILCFAGAVYGARRCTGCEIDSDSADSLGENLRENRDTGASDFFIGSLDALNVHAVFDIAVMNILYLHSKKLLAGVLKRLTKDGGLCLWSGILVEERDEVCEFAARNGLACEDEWQEDEWWCGAFILGE